MNRIDLVLQAQINNGWDIQIGADGLSWFADRISFIGFEAVQREAILVGVDGDGTDSEFVGAAENPDRDFTAIGSKDSTDR